jgi:hypothetical protein
VEIVSPLFMVSPSSYYNYELNLILSALAQLPHFFVLTMPAPVLPQWIFKNQVSTLQNIYNFVHEQQMIFTWPGYL